MKVESGAAPYRYWLAGIIAALLTLVFSLYALTVADFTNRLREAGSALAALGENWVLVPVFVAASIILVAWLGSAGRRKLGILLPVGVSIIGLTVVFFVLVPDVLAALASTAVALIILLVISAIVATLVGPVGCLLQALFVGVFFIFGVCGMVTLVWFAIGVGLMLDALACTITVIASLAVAILAFVILPKQEFVGDRVIMFYLLALVGGQTAGLMLRLMGTGGLGWAIAAGVASIIIFFVLAIFSMREGAELHIH